MKRFIMANVLVALSIVGTAIGLLCTDYPSWWHGVWFGTLSLSVLLSFVLPLFVTHQKEVRRRPWFSVYRGEDPSWQVVKHLAPDTRARIFGVLLGRLWIGFMWRTNEPAITEAECRAIDAFRRDQ